ncbi:MULTISPECIES: hypothetical protein [unclassified Methanobrevibacter]|jgi:hypothetical protein|uniref:hypothetical protein n=1 Tax=unclassified Methanobrevibacter TaxID=2638681 RepID=UPI0039B8CF56
MNIGKVAKKVVVDKFNWTKMVTGVDKSQQGGYSIQGSFVNSFSLGDGLYLSVEKGSNDFYVLYKIKNNELTIIKKYENDGMSWASEFWDSIEDNI